MKTPIKTKTIAKKKIVKKVKKLNPNKSEFSASIKNGKLGKIMPYKMTEYLEFIDWIATPRIIRDPETQEEFAKKFGISKSTLAEWKKYPDFVNKVVEKRRKHSLELTGDILKALEKEALYGNVSAIKLWLEYTGELRLKEDKNQTASPELIEALDCMRKILPD